MNGPARSKLLAGAVVTTVGSATVLGHAADALRDSTSRAGDRWTAALAAALLIGGGALSIRYVTLVTQLQCDREAVGAPLFER